MLDVHPPHEPIHGIRDFLLHLLTITIGLLIALGLEGAVEWRHHVHLRNEADGNLLSEVRDNKKDLGEALKADKDAQANLLRVLAFLDALQAGKPTDIHGIQLGMTLTDLQDASWQTASATGALSFMEYSHVKRYASAYKLQTQFQALQNETLTGFLEMQSAIIAGQDPTKLAPAEIAKGRETTLHTLAHLVALQQIGAGLNKTYDQALGPE